MLIMRNGAEPCCISTEFQAVHIPFYPHLWKVEPVSTPSKDAVDHSVTESQTDR